MIGKTLDEIFFGDSDGRREASRKDFMSLFYSDEVKYLNKITNEEYFVISGRKGTGKTVLAHYIKNKLEENDCNICNVDNMDTYLANKIEMFKNENLVNGEDKLFWQWILILEFSKIIIKEKNKSKILSKMPILNKDLIKLKKFLDTLCDKDGMKQIGKNKRMSDKIGLGIKKDSWNMSRDTTQEMAIEYSDSKYLSKLERLQELIINLKFKKNIYLILDDLDEVQTNIVTDYAFKNSIVGLLAACQTLNSRFKDLNKHSKFQIVVILREDILDSIHSISSNSNKIYDKTIRLWWSYSLEKSFSHPLIKMILYKIKNSLKSDIDDTKLYQDLFKIGKKNNRGNPRDSMVKHILERTMGRPRDIVAYFNCIKEEFPKNNNIDFSVIKKAEIKYSHWFYKEIVNEMSIYEEDEFITQVLDSLNKQNKKIFMFDEYKIFIQNHKLEYNKLTDCRKCIEFLYSFNVLGNTWDLNINQKLQRRYCWAYREDGCASPNFDQKFIVHSGLIKHFNL